MRRLAPLLILAALAGCDRRPDDVPVVVSAIGSGAPRLPARAGDPLPLPAALFAASTAQGLVRFDAAGQVEPGLAERWIVIDEGRSYIFRLADAQWGDGSRVTARQVVAGLRRAIGNRRNPLRPHLSAIDEVVEMTPLVIEVRLSGPCPDLLPLFAQPELAIPGPGGGSGPFRVEQAGDAPLLRPGYDPAAADEAADAPDAAELVQIRAERAATAILRFRERRSDYVIGGTFADWPLVDMADVSPPNRRLDPARGLFGLSVARRTGFLAAPERREAVAMAIDRAALTRDFAPDWAAAETILPDPLDSIVDPARPPWLAFDLDARRAAAQQRVAQWRAANGGVAPELTIAMPEGPGASRLAARLTADLAGVGILARRVAPDTRADLRLVDEVAPYGSARWYLRMACQPCAQPIADTLARAREAGNLAERGRLLAEADAAMVRDVAFIPLAQPLRWSLVALRLREWRGNARGWHPLNHLRGGAT
ncbi:ABC transporter substrate-binding protein [Sphingomonas spermidinifaciens]|uniref:ABC transporter substrate-binding protein n=1 Tax=Sphingomonas spermidinifaciens TaxID=1141889 RepID=A0A2A4B0D8_9SPHN|nr:ABC transporter substrate-binding protein [Sphingomonas spermidinifaciens]PCD01881.1 ABC transporter substrate-binding protein [Sphingomonas spermidinifaciens]